MLALLLALAAWGGRDGGRALEDRVGRTQVEVRSAPFAPALGQPIDGQGLSDRLRRLGYVEVQERPSRPGTWQRTGEAIWVFRRAHRADGRAVRADLIGFQLNDGRVVGGLRAGGRPVPMPSRGLWLEPEVLAGSLDEERAPIARVALDDLPEAAWRPLLALEDHRFFDHAGISARAMLRAARANQRAGRTVEGGSTITQQLIKNRDLTPRRSVDRKAAEVVRALAVEVRHDKRAILQAYLNTVYYGHHEGAAIHGIGRAARVWLGKDARSLTLGEGALLATMVQAPSALNPLRHPEAARARRDRALDRMAELGWATADEVRSAKAEKLPTRATAPPRPAATAHVRAALAWLAADDAPRRDARHLGLQIETTLDPWLQARALGHVDEALKGLRRADPRLREAPLHGAAIVLDARTGDVLAWVGGDPSARADGFDRVARARRQPGSTVKPFVLLHAYTDCGGRQIRPSTLIDDSPLTIDGWTPRNNEGRTHGAPSARAALIASYNVPFVRLSETCGRGAVASRMRRAGLVATEPIPASIALGAVEQRPIDLVGAYATFATGGERVTPRLASRIARPNGTRTGGQRARRVRVAPEGPAWLVADALRAAVAEGTGKAAAIAGLPVAGKTGTSTGGRDAWFVGFTGDIVALVWIGLDRGDLGKTGGAVAAPLWRAIVRDASALRPPPPQPAPPRSVVRCVVDPSTGLAPGALAGRKGEPGWCLRSARPPKNPPWRVDEADLVR